MSRGLDTFIYYATAPIRLFGRSRYFRWGLAAVCVAGLFFAATLWAINRLLPPSDSGLPEALAIMKPPPPLQPVTRASHVIAPVAVSLAAIGHTLDTATPREFAGKNDNPVTQLLGQAEIGLTVSRGTMYATGQSNTLTIMTPLNGNIRITGQIGNAAGKVVGGIGGAIGGLIGGGNVGKQIDNLAQKTLDQRTDFRGNVIVTSRPQLTSAWRIEPNLAGRLDFGDTSTNVAGIKVNLGSEIKSVLDPVVNNQITALQSRLRNDPAIERAAREQWVKMCRSIPLGGGKTGLPPLWLEMRPVRAAAAQPQVDARNVTITVGVQAETRILPNETKPTCPFPAQLELVPPMQDGVLAVGVPIDMPFTELNKLLEPQLKGRHFPGGRQRPGRRRGSACRPFRVRRTPADLAAREGARKEELVRLRHGGDGACLGQARARPGKPDSPAHRYFARSRVGGGIRPARHRCSRGHALCAEGAGRKSGDRPQAFRQRCENEDRCRAQGLPAGRRRCAGRHLRSGPAPHRH